MDINMLRLALAVDITAAVMMLGTLLHIRLTVRADKTKGSTFQYYRYFAWAVVAVALIDYFWAFVDVFGLDRLPEGGLLAAMGETRTWLYLSMAADILEIFMTTVLLYLWLLFLCRYLYRDREYIRRNFRRWIAPLFISGVIGIAAIILIIYTGKETFVYWIAYILFFVIRVYYFILSLWLIYDFKEQDGVMKFFDIRSLFLPMFAGWILEDIFGIPFRALGSGIGVFLLYLSMAREQRYVDQETGLYTTDYCAYLKKLIRSGKLDFHSAVIFTVKDAARIAELSGDLLEMLPPDCEAIHRSEREIMALLKVRERGPLSALAEDAKEFYDVETAVALRGKTESAGEFLERML